MTDDIERALVEFFSARPEDVVAVYLFGSVARGEARPTSDVDVAVLYGASAPEAFGGHVLGLQWDLSGVLGREVDVVRLNDASPDLVHRVLRDGRLVVERDPVARVRFEVGKRAEYLDLLPYLREYRRGAA